MAIKSLELINLGPFRPRPVIGRRENSVRKLNSSIVKIDFDKQFNLFTGPNNVGNSTILQVVNLLTQRWTDDFQYRYQQRVGFPHDPSSPSEKPGWRAEKV